MQALVRARSAQAGLQQATRLLSSSITVLSEVGDQEHGGSSRQGQPRRSGDSYSAWGKEVYHFDKKALGRNQRGAAQQRQQQQGGERQQDRDRRPRRQHRREQQGEGEAGQAEGGFQANLADRFSSMEGARYVRVAPKGEQRQHRMWPVAMVTGGKASLLREDVAAFFDGYNLTPEEIRPEFSWKHFDVERYWLNFGSAVDRELGMSRHTAYLGTRRVLLRKALPSDFTSGIFNPMAMSSRGRYVLVDNLSPTSTSEDVIRYFQGYDLHAKSVSFLRDQDSKNGKQQRGGRGGSGGGGGGGSSSGSSGQSEKAIVRFTSRMEAHRAVRDKQGGFCGNSAVHLRVLP